MSNLKKKDLLLGILILFIFFLFFLPTNRIEIEVRIYNKEHLRKYIPDALTKENKKETKKAGENPPKK